MKGTFAWLKNTKESGLKGTKHEISEQLLVALEALLPDLCQVCNEEYTVDRLEKPGLCCKGCRQGFHQACYDRMEIGDSLAELPGEFSWLCSVCAPLYSLKTVLGGRRGQERPKLNRRGPAVAAPPIAAAAPPTAAAEEPAEDQSAVPAEGVDQGAGEVPQGPLQPPPDPPILPEHVPPSVDQERPGIGEDSVHASSQVCSLFLSGDCPYGISGKTGGTCPNSHPRRCPLYMRWGDRSDRGCSGTTCGKAHPTLCPNSLELRCLDRFCKWKLHTQRCHRPGSGSDWRGPNQGNRTGDYNRNGNRFQDQARRDMGHGQGRSGYQNYNHDRAYIHDQQRAWGGQNQHSEGGFQGMTAQQSQLGAYRMTGFEQQLQEAVTRAVVMALTATNRAGGLGGVGPATT